MQVTERPQLHEDSGPPVRHHSFQRNLPNATISNLPYNEFTSACPKLSLYSKGEGKWSSHLPQYLLILPEGWEEEGDKVANATSQTIMRNRFCCRKSPFLNSSLKPYMLVARTRPWNITSLLNSPLPCCPPSSFFLTSSGCRGKSPKPVSNVPNVSPPWEEKRGGRKGKKKPLMKTYILLSHQRSSRNIKNRTNSSEFWCGFNFGFCHWESNQVNQKCGRNAAENMNYCTFWTTQDQKKEEKKKPYILVIL